MHARSTFFGMPLTFFKLELRWVSVVGGGWRIGPISVISPLVDMRADRLADNSLARISGMRLRRVQGNFALGFGAPLRPWAMHKRQQKKKKKAICKHQDRIWLSSSLPAEKTQNSFACRRSQGGGDVGTRRSCGQRQTQDASSNECTPMS